MADRPVMWTGRELARALGTEWSSRAGEAVRARGLGFSNKYEVGDAVLTDGDAATQMKLLASGAAAVLAKRAAASLVRSYPVMEVGDVVDAVERIAVAARERCKARIVAVTGSVGKSWTKQALGHALALQGPTSITPGNLNSREGVCLALAQTERTARFGVYEIGMGGPGTVLRVARVVRPHVVVITAIAPAHVVEHPSFDSIVDTKAAICEALEPGGTAVLPRDSEHYPRLLEAAQQANVQRVLTFGQSDDAVVRVVDYHLSAEGSDVTVDVGGARHSYRLRQAGFHLVRNSLAVLAAAFAVGADWRKVAHDMSDARRMEHRGSPGRLDMAGGSITVMDDTYNNNPAAMRAAIEVLGLHTPGPGGSRIAVLGDMALQGDRGPEAHAQMAGPILDNGVDCVITLGKEIEHTRAGLPAEILGPHCESPEAVRDALLERLRPGDVVLFKGSIVTTRLDRAVQLLYKAVGTKPVPWD